VRILFGIFLMICGFCWAAFWSAGAAMTSETGIWNSATWAIMLVAALGLIPFCGGIYLCARVLLGSSARPKKPI
jgi:hypothetical protein